MSENSTTTSTGRDDSSDLSAEARTGREGASSSNDDTYIVESMFRDGSIHHNEVWLAPPKNPKDLCLRAGDVIQYEDLTPGQDERMIVAMVMEVRTDSRLNDVTLVVRCV
jgi:hypothetical protein